MSSAEAARTHAHYLDLWSRLQNLDELRPPRRGPRDSAIVLLAKVTDGSLFRRLDRIRHALAAEPNVVTVPDHFLHLPVLDLGRVRPSRRLAMQVENLLRRTGPIVVDIAKVNADEREAFGELHPPDSLLDLRALLRPLAEHPGADEPFLPRLPLGRIVGPVDARSLSRALQWFRDRPIGQIRVERLTLARLRRRPFPWIQSLAGWSLEASVGERLETGAILAGSPRGDRIVV